jgi:PKD repeat protein
VSHTYTSPGTYTVQVTQADTLGSTSTTSRQIEITAPAPPVSVPAIPAGAPVCASVPTPPTSTKGTVTLSVAQVRTNQRIYSAGIRRAAAIERWLAEGIVGTDLCAGGLTANPFGAGISLGAGPGGPATGPVPNPRPIVPRPPTKKTGVRFSVSPAQLQINQKIASALVRRANGLRDRLNAGLTGGDIQDRQVTAAALSPAIAITGATPVPNPPPPSTTTVAPATTKAGVVFTATAGQLEINQRIGAAAIRRLNAVRDRLLTGLAGDDFRADSITAVDLALRAAPLEAEGSGG